MSEPRTPSVQTDDPRDVEWAREFIGRIEGIAEEWQGGGPFPGLSVSYEALRRKLREVRMGQASRDDVLEEAAKAAEATDPVHYGVGWSGTPEHPGGSESYSKPRHESMRCALAIRLLKSKQPTEHPQAAEPLIGRPPEQQRAMDAARDAALAFVPGTRQPTGQPPSDVSSVGKVEKLGDLWCVYFPERAPYTFSTEEAATRMLSSLRAGRTANPSPRAESGLAPFHETVETALAAIETWNEDDGCPCCLTRFGHGQVWDDDLEKNVACPVEDLRRALEPRMADGSSPPEPDRAALLAEVEVLRSTIEKWDRKFHDRRHEDLKAKIERRAERIRDDKRSQWKNLEAQKNALRTALERVADMGVDGVAEQGCPLCLTHPTHTPLSSKQIVDKVHHPDCWIAAALAVRTAQPTPQGKDGT